MKGAVVTGRLGLRLRLGLGLRCWGLGAAGEHGAAGAVAGPVGAFLCEMVFFRLVVVGTLQDLKQLFDQSVVALFGTINGQLCQIVSKHEFRIDSRH